MYHVIAIVRYYTQWGERGKVWGGGGYDAGIPTIRTYLKSTIPLLPVGALQINDRRNRVFLRL